MPNARVQCDLRLGHRHLQGQVPADYCTMTLYRMQTGFSPDSSEYDRVYAACLCYFFHLVVQ